jgi:hypothetical protein
MNNGEFMYKFGKTSSYRPLFKDVTGPHLNIKAFCLFDFANATISWQRSIVEWVRGID